MSTPVWLDNNVLVGIDNGTMPYAESEIIKLQRDGFEPLLPPSVEREFLHGQGFKQADTLRRQALLKRLGVEVDTMANHVPMKQLIAWREEAVERGLSIPDADIIAQVKAGAQARGIRNPAFLTRDAGGTLKAMRNRGVMALEFKAGMPTPESSTPKPTAPRPSVSESPIPEPSTRLSAIKAGVKAGLKEVFSAENIAAMIPDLVLAVADRMAARDAVRRIQIKFLKEGFAKGVAAGAMGWTEEELTSNLKNRVTPFRIQGLEDPSGLLSLSYMLHLAEATENYAVYVGYQFSIAQSRAWKKDMLAKGMPILYRYGYNFGTDPAALFEYEFIDKLAWTLRPATDSIVEPAIYWSSESPRFLTSAAATRHSR